MKFLVREPGTGRTAELSKAQFDLVHDDLVEYMNNAMGGPRRGRNKPKLDDQAIINKLAAAGLPVNFGDK